MTRDAPAEPVSRGVTVETVEALRVDILNNWLLDAESFRGKSVGEEAELLRKKYGDAAVGFDSLMLDRAATVSEIAKIAYGNSKYPQLLRMSNPNLPTDETPVPSYQNIYFLQPLLALATILQHESHSNAYYSWRKQVAAIRNCIESGTASNAVAGI